MAEEEVNYTTVKFKSKKPSSPEAKKEEEAVYDDVKVQSDTTEQTDDANVPAAFMADKRANNRRGKHQKLACCLGILCVVLLLGVKALCVYIMTLNDESEQNQLKENQTALLAANQDLTNLNEKLSSENENWSRVHKNLTAENQNLKTQIQELETQSRSPTGTTRDMETKWNELNVSQAQWSIDAYCPLKIGERRCKPCQEGWEHFQSSCYVFNNAEPAEQRTWDEAQANCRGKNSDLVVIASREEMIFVSNSSWSSAGITGYWIGLKVQDKKWLWIDGSNLSENSWIRGPSDGHCATSVYKDGLRLVNCGNRNAWICKKNSLSV